MFFDELGDVRVSLSAAYILITFGVFGGNTTVACVNAGANIRADTHTNLHKTVHRLHFFSLSMSAAHVKPRTVEMHKHRQVFSLTRPVSLSHTHLRTLIYALSGCDKLAYDS